MPKLNGNRIIYDKTDWISGLHSRYNAGPTTVPLLEGNQLSYSLGFHPFRAYGIATPGFLPTSVTNASVVTGSAMRKIIMAAETSTYFGYGINGGELLFQMSTAGTLTSNGTWPHSIVSASGTEEGSSICAYSGKIGGTRAMRVYYSYSSSGAGAGDPQWNVGVYSLDGSTFDDDFMTTAPATPLVSTVAGGGAAFRPHPMIVGDDDILYIGDGNLVHGYDGANAADNDGKFFASVLTLPANFMITGFAKFQKNLCIVGFFQLTTPSVSSTVAIDSFQRTESRAYFWDYVNDDPWDSKTLNDNYVSGAFEYKGTVGCFTQGRKIVPGNPQFSKLLLFNGSEFEPVATFDTNVPNEGAIEILGDTISFVSQGNIYMYGSPYPSEGTVRLNRVGKGNGSSNGGICTLSTTIQVVSTGTTTSGGLDTVNSGFTTGFATTGSISPVFGKGKVGKVKNVKVYYANTNSATNSRQFFLYLLSNLTSSTEVLSGITTVDNTNQVTTVYLDTSGNTLIPFTNLGLVLEWSGGSGTNCPTIERIEVEYEEMGQNDIDTY